MALFPALCLMALVVFLGGLGLFALAVTRVVAPEGRGHERGVVGGLASLLAVLMLCAMGLAGLTATVAAIGVGSLAHWNPIEHIEVRRTPVEPEQVEGHGPVPAEDEVVSARFTVRGNAGAELVELLHDLVDVDLDELGDGMTVEHHRAEDGDEFAVYEFRLPISGADLEDFRDDLRRELGGMQVRLPESVEVRLQGVE